LKKKKKNSTLAMAWLMPCRETCCPEQLQCFCVMGQTLGLQAAACTPLRYPPGNRMVHGALHMLRRCWTRLTWCPPPCACFLDVLCATRFS
jgi:hypothetical protein